MTTTDPLQTPPLLGGRTLRALAIGVVASIQLIAGLFVVLNLNRMMRAPNFSGRSSRMRATDSQGASW